MMYTRLMKLLSIVCLSLLACKKKDRSGGTTPPPPPPVDTAVIIQPAVDPPIASTTGFFLNDWQGKTFTAPAFTEMAAPASTSVAVTIDASSIVTKIPVSLYGNNANPYMSQMVDQPVLLDHIKNLNPHIIRFPGGNLSSVFFWNAPKGVPPADAPAQMYDNGVLVSSGYWFGKNTESWTLSTDNYYQMLQQTGNEGMITINHAYARYGTAADPVAAAAHLAADWVRYDNGRTRYWEIGNESNGTWQAGYRIDVSQNKDGQPEYITGDLYGRHFKVFADSMRKAAAEKGKTIYIGAQLLEKPAAAWQTATDKSWNQGVLTQAGNAADFYIVHTYYTPYQTNSNPADILKSATLVTKEMMEYMHQVTQTYGAPLKPIALTEWNIFAEGSKQMVSHVAGMHAVMVLGELMKNKFGMASRWDLANGYGNGNDHGMFSKGDGAGESLWNPRPAFYHMYYFQKMMGDRYITSTSNNTNVDAYGSTYSSGQAAVVLVNKSTVAQNVQVTVKNFRPGNRFYWYTLSGGDDNGQFSARVFVNGLTTTGSAGGPSNYTAIKPYSSSAANGIKVSVPPMSVVYMAIDKK